MGIVCNADRVNDASKQADVWTAYNYDADRINAVSMRASYIMQTESTQ